MTDVITDVHQASAAWLTRVLLEHGHLYLGRVTQVQHFRTVEAPLQWDVMPYATGTRLELFYSGDVEPRTAPRHLFLKLSTGLDFEMGAREAEFYRILAPAMQAALPEEQLPFVRRFDVAYSRDTGESHLLLEDLSSTHVQTDSALPPTQAEAEQAVDALAEFHAFWWEHPRLGDDIGTRPSGESIQGLIAQAQDRLAGLVDFSGDRLPDARRRTLERVCAAWPPRRLERSLAGKGITVVNLDTHPGNFLYPRDPDRGKVRIIDWQHWDIATGTDDLAYMMVAHWYPERRARQEKRLLERYFQRLRLYGVKDYEWADCWYDYRASIIHTLFLLVGRWHARLAPSLWWDRLQRALLAYEDIGCRELLPGR
jgi:hypothetical protein